MQHAKHHKRHLNDQVHEVLQPDYLALQHGLAGFAALVKNFQPPHQVYPENAGRFQDCYKRLHF